MKRVLILLSIAASLFILESCMQQTTEENQSRRKVIIGYVPGYNGVIDVSTIDANKLTHINYAFVNVKDSLALLTNLKTDSINFRNLITLKKQNPDLKILISIGGWSWSKNFSDAVFTESSRKKFAKSSADIVSKYNLDGVDIDWEYPNQPGDSNVYRPEDKQNYTLMFEAIRAELNELSKETNKSYLLTTAVGADMKYINNTEMDKVGELLDYINLMTYDYFTLSDSSGHHTNLYPSVNYYTEHSAKRSFNEFVNAGVPKDKLVMGIAFYGRSWYVKSDDNHGINRPADSSKWIGGYTYIKDSLINSPGYELLWDDNAKAAYLFNSELNHFITFDDERSVKYKCEFVIDNDMAGVMFWQYMSDPKEHLLNVINSNL